MRVINQAIENNRFIQDQILKDIEIERQQLEKIAFEEAEKLRKINMEKLEAERL